MPSTNSAMTDRQRQLPLIIAPQSPHGDRLPSVLFAGRSTCHNRRRGCGAMRRYATLAPRHGSCGRAAPLATVEDKARMRAHGEPERGLGSKHKTVDNLLISVDNPDSMWKTWLRNWPNRSLRSSSCADMATSCRSNCKPSLNHSTAYPHLSPHADS